MVDWGVRVVGAPGVAYTPVFLRGAKPLSLRNERLPGLGRFRFAISTKAADARLLDPDLLPNREVQMWRGGRCVGWGWPLQPQADLSSTVFDCVGLGHGLSRRYFGPIATNFVDPNADFEAGLTGWTAVNCTATASTEWRAKGTQSAKLVQATAGTDAYLRRRVTVNTAAVPDFYAAKALLHKRSAGWPGPPLDQRGLYLELQSSPGGALVAGVDPQWEPLTNFTAPDALAPVRMETGISVPAGLTGACIEVRLYVAGTVFYDATSLSLEESVGTLLTPAGLVPEGCDVLFSRIVAWAQAKRDLGFVVVKESGTFPTVVRVHQFYDNASVLDALLEDYRGGRLEWAVTWPDDGSQRELRVWPGRRGTTKAAAVTLGTNVGEDATWGADVGAVTTAARSIGQGTGARREVGYSENLTSVSRLLESIDTAPPEALPDDLQHRAEQMVSDQMAVRRTPRFPVRAALVFDNRLEPGDRVPVTANYGYIQESGANRTINAIDVDAERDVAVIEWEA